MSDKWFFWITRFLIGLLAIIILSVIAQSFMDKRADMQYTRRMNEAGLCAECGRELEDAE